MWMCKKLQYWNRIHKIDWEVLRMRSVLELWNNAPTGLFSQQKLIHIMLFIFECSKSITPWPIDIFLFHSSICFKQRLPAKIFLYSYPISAMNVQWTLHQLVLWNDTRAYAQQLENRFSQFSLTIIHHKTRSSDDFSIWMYIRRKPGPLAKQKKKT